MKFNRAYRRAQRARLMKKRRHHYGGIDSWTGVTEAQKQGILSCWSRTATLCSCDMCGNARRNRWNSAPLRITMQERKFLSYSVKDEIDVA